MKRLVIFFGVVGAVAWCFFRGHAAARRVPIGGDPRSGLWGLRCPECGTALDPEYVRRGAA